MKFDAKLPKLLFVLPMGLLVMSSGPLSAAELIFFDMHPAEHRVYVGAEGVDFDVIHSCEVEAHIEEFNDAAHQQQVELCIAEYRAKYPPKGS